jgi:hypothetical protein
MDLMTSIITPIVALISAIIGALIGGRMSQIASLKATAQAHKNNLELQKKAHKIAINSLKQALYDETFLSG